ncbi:MAG: hypothetical protein ABI369_09660 [Acetobacteraceae bacterium]
MGDSHSQTGRSALEWRHQWRIPANSATHVIAFSFAPGAIVGERYPAFAQEFAAR